jgi:hypothetical protein
MSTTTATTTMATMRKTATLEGTLLYNVDLGRARRACLVRIRSAEANASSLRALREDIAREIDTLAREERELAERHLKAMDAIERRRFPDETD